MYKYDVERINLSGMTQQDIEYVRYITGGKKEELSQDVLDFVEKQAAERLAVREQRITSTDWVAVEAFQAEADKNQFEDA